MKITDAKTGFGSKIAAAPSVDRGAFRDGGNVGAALAEGIANYAEQRVLLQRAEEDAKADELKADFETDYLTQENALAQEHKRNNFSTEEYRQKHESILDNLKTKYSNSFDWQTSYGEKFGTFLDSSLDRKRVRYEPTLNEVALTNQAASWQATSLKRQNAAINADYQTLENQIQEHKKLTRSPQYLVAYGEKAPQQEATWIANTYKSYLKRQYAEGKPVDGLIEGLSNPMMYKDMSEDTRTDLMLWAQGEKKKEEAAARKQAKADAKTSRVLAAKVEIQTRGALDPKSKDHKDAFPLILKDAIETLPAQQAIQRARDVRVDFGYIEPEEVHQITASFNSKDEKKVSLAVQSAADYFNRDQRLTQYFDDEVVDIVNLHQSGYTPMEAVEQYTVMSQMPPARKNELSLRLDNDDFLEKSLKEVKSRTDDLWEAEYDSDLFEDVAGKVFKDKYVFYNGNKRAAESATQQFLVKNYAITKIGGEDSLMFQAPSTYIRQQTTWDFEPEQIKDIFLEEVVEATPLSVSQAQEAKIYRVPSNDKKGNPQYAVFYYGQPVLTKANKPAVWTFDIDKAMDVLFADRKAELDAAAQDSRARVQLLLEGKAGYDENALENVGDNM